MVLAHPRLRRPERHPAVAAARVVAVAVVPLDDRKARRARPPQHNPPPLEVAAEEAAEAAGKSGMRPCYAGREVAASPATGYASRHQVQQEALVNIALGLNGTAPNVRSDCK